MTALDVQRLGDEGRRSLQIAFQEGELRETVEAGADEQRMVQLSGQRQRLLEQRNPRVTVAAVARGSPVAEQGHGQTGRFVAVLAQEVYAERRQLGGIGMILPR